MKALAVDSSGALSFVEVPQQEINEFQVKVRMLSGGICNGTDLKLIHGKFKGFDAYPAILGHEGIGEVIALGSKVENFKLGDRVFCPFQEGDNGGYHSGWGAFAEYGICWDWQSLVKHGVSEKSSEFPASSYTQSVLPSDIDPVDGAMMITFREVLSAMKTFSFAPNKSVVIFGCGPVGCSFIKFSKLMGLGPVIACDLQEDRLEKAKALGADYVLNSKSPDLAEDIRKICPGGVDFAVDAVGRSEIINQALNLVTFNGKICVYGISPNNSMNIDWTNSEYNWQLQFVQWPTKIEEAAATTQIVNWVQSGALVPSDFYSHVIPFDDIIKGFEMTSNQASFKVMIRF